MSTNYFRMENFPYPAKCFEDISSHSSLEDSRQTQTRKRKGYPEAPDDDYFKYKKTTKRCI